MTFPDVQPKLDRVPFFDERSRAFGVSRMLSGRTITRRKRIWTTVAPLDQGREGACVGFAIAGELAATPRRHQSTNDSARQLYQFAREQDREMGNVWNEGASVLAGVKAAVKLGLVLRYFWAFSVDEIIDAVIARGPVVLGVNWYSAMYQTNPDGLVTVEGVLVGGHAILLNGFWPNHPAFGQDMLVWTNSWGADYGINGRGFVRVPDLARLLSGRGEAVVMLDSKPPLLEVHTPAEESADMAPPHEPAIPF